MSTQHDIEKEQEAQSRASLPVQDQQASPQLPPRSPRPKSNRWVLIGAVIVALAIIFSVFAYAISQQRQQPGSQVKPTPTAPTTKVTPGASDTTPTPKPGVTQGPQKGPPSVSDPAYWDQVLGTKGTNGKVESVSFANVLGNPSLQALVTVRHSDANGTLDVYVFDKITSANPTQLFNLPGLIKGDAKISYYNSIMTAQVDQNSIQNAGEPAAQWTADFFREFEWNDAQGKLVQVAFPGIFPDLTRYQAEADQALVKKGQDTWKNDAAQVAKALASENFIWSREVTTKVLSGGGANDVYATVQVQEPPVQGGPKQGPTATVKLSRLEGNTHNMWVAIAVQDGTDTLTNIQARSLIANPVKLEGKGSAFEGVIGTAIIADHQRIFIGLAILRGTPGMGNASYSIWVSYDSSFKTGPQEGIVEIALFSPVEADPYSWVMVKVLLDPKPVAVLGPVSCPPVTQLPGYWAHFPGLDPNTSTVGTVSCANMKGDPSLQALVPVSYNDGKPGEIYVYDDITNAHPVQIFKLQTKSAKISGVSTIITQDGDLYREFQWSKSDGKFVQVAFPGMYPDLTRWQAEDHQAAVMQGEKGISNFDAVTTAQKLLGGTAKLVKGGGPNDLTAVVNVTFPSPGSPSSIPVTQVTLSRLEGNPTGIWEVTWVGSNWLIIYTPKSGTTISSPVRVTGFGPQFEAQVGVVYILDRLYHEIQVGDNFAMLPDGSSPPARFSLDVPYKSSIQGGAQEGIVKLVHTSGASFDYGVVMVKVLVNP